MSNRAYSIITIKAVDEKRRIFSGVATTPEVDRVDDTIDPMGASFKNPLVLLHQHNDDEPIGQVRLKTPTKAGIEFEAEIPIISEPPSLKERVDVAWGEIKSGLVRAVSIGFRPIKYAFIENGGIEFQEIEIYELSTVSIPANASALINSVKSIDRTLRQKAGVAEPTRPTNPNPTDRKPLAAPGTKAAAVVRLTPPASGNSKSSKPKEGNVKISEKIARFEEKRAANMARIGAIHEETDESLNDAQLEEIKGLEAEIDTIDRDLPSLKRAQAALAKTAKPVVVEDPENPGKPLRATPGVSVKAPPKPEPGIRFARYARCIGLAHRMKTDVLRVAEELYKDRDPDVVEMIKAAGTAIGALNTTTDAALIGNTGGFADFVDFLRARTIVGRFGANGIPALRQVPFRVPLITQSTGGTGYWVGEGDGKPLTKPSFARTELAPLKVAAISVATMETLRDSSPSAERLLRDDLAAAIMARMDTSFADPTYTANAGVNPASITNGAESVASTGSDADAIRLDVRAVMQKFIDAKNPLTSGVWIMSSANALALSMLKNSLGQSEFPAITINGGIFEGLPAIVSDYVTDYVVLANATDIWFGDDGGIAIDMSTEASLQMVAGDDEGSTQNSITPTATSVVSLWQTNSVGFRAERTVNWARRRTSAVAYLSSVEWGGHVPPS